MLQLHQDNVEDNIRRVHLKYYDMVPWLPEALGMPVRNKYSCSYSRQAFICLEVFLHPHHCVTATVRINHNEKRGFFY